MTSANDGTIVEKIMAVSEAEFAASLDRLMPGRTLTASGGVARQPLGSGTVEIRFQPLPPVRLGGLLELPRAKVSLVFDAVPATEQSAFVRAFDLAFQRGGG